MRDVIFSGRWGNLHCQGMTMDKEKKFIYCSFTTKLVKTDVDGNVIGSVDNIVGHLGCIDFNDEDGKVYASLEYKNDSIGRDILDVLGQGDRVIKDAFYIAIFDGDKIDRLDMDAEKDGVMRTVFLKTVLDDYSGAVIAPDGEKVEHVHGCSGIDGLAIGRDFGGNGNFLNVCYGVYSDLSREDNDYQVILQYDIAEWWENALPLRQRDMHAKGPGEPRNKFFVYTGNTCYGIQNLEYDAFSGDYFAFVYRGEKPNFMNYDFFRIDGSVPAKKQKLLGQNVMGSVLTLKKVGEESNGISGGFFPFGSMGVHSLGNGTFYFVEPDFSDPHHLFVNSVRYTLSEKDGKTEFVRFDK